MNEFYDKLFWYNVKCPECGQTKEKTYDPAGKNYGEKYEAFARHCGGFSYQKTLEFNYCENCRKTLRFEITQYAPSYTGVQ